jgi:hypothetical protein
VVVAVVFLMLSPGARADQLVYRCADGNSDDLCLVNPDAPSEHSRLIETTDADEENPVFSPDGSLIAYVGQPIDASRDVYVVDAGADSATSAIDVSDTPTRYENPHPPAWSPDGTFLAYASQSSSASNAPQQTFVAAADGTTDPVALGGGAEGNWPTWAPDGIRIAFGCCGTGVAITAADGSGTPTHLIYAGAPAWSPDGSTIAVFDAVYETVRLISPDGSDSRVLAGNVIYSPDKVVDWSPDSTRLAYVGSDEHGGHVEVARRDGSGSPVSIPMPPGYIVARDPDFSPDGTRVAFSAFHNTEPGHSRIMVAPADGSAAAVAITSDLADSGEPDWRPHPVVPPVVPGGGGASGGSGTPGGGTSPGGPGGAPSATGTRTPVRVNLTLLNHPHAVGAKMTVALIDCDAQGGNPTGGVAETCAAHASAYAQSSAPARGRAWARAQRRVTKKPLFAAGRVKVPAGKKKPLTMRITPAGQKLLGTGKPLSLKVTITVRHGSAKPETKTATVTVQRRHPKQRVRRT